jgi:hypothetical protein
MVCKPVVADMHHFDEDPDPHQNGKRDLDQHRIVSDAQQ